MGTFLMTLTMFVYINNTRLIKFAVLGHPVIVKPLMNLFLKSLRAKIVVKTSLRTMFVKIMGVKNTSTTRPKVTATMKATFTVVLNGNSRMTLALTLPVNVLNLRVGAILCVFVMNVFTGAFSHLTTRNGRGRVVTLRCKL